MKKLFLKAISVLAVVAMTIPLFSGMALAAEAPQINGKTDLGWVSVTYSSNVQKPYTMTIIVTGSPEPTVKVTGTAGAYYKDGKIVVPMGLKASTTPYTVNLVAENSAGKATMGIRVNVVEMPAVNGYWKKSVTLNFKQGYAGPYALPCVVTGLPAPKTEIDTEIQGVNLNSGKLYIPAGLTAENSPYTIKVSATNTILDTAYTAVTTYTINVYLDDFDQTGTIEKPAIVGPEAIVLEEGYEERPSYSYTFTGKPYPVITATGVDGVEVVEGKVTLPLGLNAETRDYLLVLTANNDYGSDVMRVAITVMPKADPEPTPPVDQHTQGEGEPEPTPAPTQEPDEDGDEDPDPTPEPTAEATPAPTKKPSSGGGSSSSGITVEVNGHEIPAKQKDGKLTMSPTKKDILAILGDMDESEYEFDLSTQDYESVTWKMDPKWFDGIPDDALIIFKQPAGNVTITGSMMKKLIEKAPSGVVDFTFRGKLTFIIEKGSNRAKWNDEDEPIIIEIPYEGDKTEGFKIIGEQSGTYMPDATDVSYADGFVSGTVYYTGKYAVE